MAKGGADNRKHRQQRRGKRKKVFTGIATHKLSKLEQAENTYSDENVNVPPDVTASATAVSVDNPAESNSTAASGSTGFPDEETEWIDIAVEEEIETKQKMKDIATEVVEERELLGYRLFDICI